MMGLDFTPQTRGFLAIDDLGQFEGSDWSLGEKLSDPYSPLNYEICSDKGSGKRQEGSNW